MNPPVDVSRILGQPVDAAGSITIWDARSLGVRRRAAPALFQHLADALDELGKRSMKAQGLAHVLTSTQKMFDFSEHRVYVFATERQFIGILKVGTKKLFIRTRSGALTEMDPLCVLDFYVHESCQRGGIGKALFETMLAREGRDPAHFGYDRPSPKLLGFLRKHYALCEFVPQTNNFVVFDRCFDKQSSSSSSSSSSNANANANAKSKATAAASDAIPKSSAVATPEAMPRATAPPQPTRHPAVASQPPQPSKYDLASQPPQPSKYDHAPPKNLSPSERTSALLRAMDAPKANSAAIAKQQNENVYALKQQQQTQSSSSNNPYAASLYPPVTKDTSVAANQQQQYAPRASSNRRASPTRSGASYDIISLAPHQRNPAAAAVGGGAVAYDRDAAAALPKSNPSTIGTSVNPALYASAMGGARNAARGRFF